MSPEAVRPELEEALEAPEAAEAVEQEEEALAPKVPRAPEMPNAAEVERHKASGHIQYRSWCACCAAGRAPANQHRRAPEDPYETVPTISIDYGYLNKKHEDEGTNPILVAKERRRKNLWASMLQAKGENDFAVKQLESVVRESGYRKVRIKSDGEASIVALKNAARARLTGVEVIHEESPVDDHQANGDAEVAIKDVKGLVRTMKLSTEADLNIRIQSTHPIISWIPRHVAFLASRLRVLPNGRTSDELRTGRRWRKPLVVFGERILFREAKARREKDDLSSRWQTGYYVGTCSKTASLLVMTKEGVIRASSFKIMSAEERFEVIGWDELKGTPWCMRPRERQQLSVAEDEAQAPGAAPDLEEEMQLRPMVRRRLYVTQNDIERFGPTEGCDGCETVQGGAPPAAAGGRVRRHTQVCRDRVSELLARDSEGSVRVEQARSRMASRPVQGNPEGAETDAAPARAVDQPPAAEEEAPVGMEISAERASGAPGGAPEVQDTENRKSRKRQADVDITDIDPELQGDQEAIVVRDPGSSGASGSAGPGQDGQAASAAASATAERPMDVGGIDELERLELSEAKIKDLNAIEELVGDVYQK